MADNFYPVPEDPAYLVREIRQLQDTDPASATQTINPLIEKLLESIEYLNLYRAALGGDGKVLAEQLPEVAAAAKTLAATVIPENADLNDYVTPGWYQCTTNATAATLENCPTNEAFSLEVVPSSINAVGAKGVIQRVASYRPPNVQIWCRNIHGATYGDWAQVYTTANKPSAVDLGVSNLNLVDNWYFIDPINQRGKTVDLLRN